MTKKIISMRVGEKLLEEFDKLEGSRSSNVVKAMEEHLKGNTNKYQGITKVGEELRARVKALEEDKTFLGDRIRELEIANSELRKSFAFEQQAHFETQKRLPPFQGKWWQFWRK